MASEGPPAPTLTPPGCSLPNRPKLLSKYVSRAFQFSGQNPLFLVSLIGKAEFFTAASQPCTLGPPRYLRTVSRSRCRHAALLAALTDRGYAAVSRTALVLASPPPGGLFLQTSTLCAPAHVRSGSDATCSVRPSLTVPCKCTLPSSSLLVTSASLP